MRQSLERRGLQVRMIEGHAVLQERTRAALGADLFVSIHHDSVRPELLPDADLYSGFSLFVSRLNPQAGKSIACASAIGAQMRSIGLAPSRYHADPVLGENRPYADEANGVHFTTTWRWRAPRPCRRCHRGRVIVNRHEEQRLREPQMRAASLKRSHKECVVAYHKRAGEARRRGSRRVPWIEIGQERIDTFARAIEDFQWIHVDPVRARSSPFGGNHRARLSHALAPVAPVRDDFSSPTARWA